MQDDPRSAKGPRDIWLNQPTEQQTMIGKLILQRSRELRARTRKKLLGALVGPVAVGLFYAFGMRVLALPAWTQLAFGLALLWSIAGVYFLSRGVLSSPSSLDAGLSTGLEFCRQELGRQLTLLRRMLVWSFGPILLAIFAFIFALGILAKSRIVPNGLPFLALVVVWIGWYFWIRLREQRALRNELEELSEMVRENAG